MPAGKLLACTLPLALLASGALAQVSGGIGAGTGSAGSSVSGPSTGIGIPAVPNNRLAPLPGSTVESTTPGLAPTTPGLGATAPGLGATTPGLGATTPGLGTTTPGLGTTTTTPGLSTPIPSIGTTPGVIIEFPPPSPSARPTFDATRVCPSGVTFC